MRLLFFLIFFSLNLFNFRFPLLKNVILAFWQPRKLLLLTFTLFLILEYISSLFGYTFFYSYYNGICESTLVCFLSTFDQTFKVWKLLNLNLKKKDFFFRIMEELEDFLIILCKKIMLIFQLEDFFSIILTT